MHLLRHRGRALALLVLTVMALPRIASAVPSFARQTGMPCSQCHTLSFGPALTAYGRQFKLNGYTFGEGEHPMPVAIMIQGGYSHADQPLPAAPVAHFANNDNISLDQVSLFVGTRISEFPFRRRIVDRACVGVVQPGLDFNRRSRWQREREPTPYIESADTLFGNRLNLRQLR